MTYEEYWDGDNELPKIYRKKHEYEKEERNFWLWLQGAYIYEAVLDASPVLNALSKKKKPITYRSEPIPLSDKENTLLSEEKNNRKMKNGIEAMKAMMVNVNRRFENEQQTDRTTRS